MMQAPLSTSSSEPHPRSGIRSIAWSIAGILAVFLAFEAIVAVMFSMPPGAREPSGSLERYFSYGYSIESKLSRSVGYASQEPAAIVRAGWIPTELYPPGETWDSAPARVVVYGMSFTKRVAAELTKIRPELAISTRAGPGAPFNHSFAMFEADPWRSQADVVVVGILSSSLSHMQSLSGLGFTPESPAPYAFPLFTLDDGELHRRDPIIADRDVFVQAFRERSDEWNAHLAAIAEHDAYWDRFVFSHSILDRSALIRLVRRAWASRNIDIGRSKVYTNSKGYKTEHPAMAAVPAMLAEMQAACDRDGQMLVVLLLHARGEPGHLDSWLADTLAGFGIEVISSIDLFSSLDAMNFGGDGHYRPHLDAAIADALAGLIPSYVVTPSASQAPLSTPRP
jgi:hypothetical protein